MEEVAKKFEKTVSMEPSVTHPLNSKWTLWFTKPSIDKSESWADLLRPVTSFKTVEEFWAVHQNVPEPNELPLKSDYHYFRGDIRPEWEDEANAKGGKWSFQFKTNTQEHGTTAIKDVNDQWLQTVLAVIGETIDEDEPIINGVVLSIRRGNVKIALWTKTDQKELLSGIGSRFKNLLKVGEEDHVEFFPHSSSGKHSQPTIIL